MSDPERPALLRAARVTGIAGLWASGLGPAGLLVLAWTEVLNRPGLTLVDGYWIGREPWTSIGVVTALTGAVAGLLGGALVLALEGGWWRRFLLVPAVAGAGLWWAVALGALPFPGFAGPDPVAFAYSLPATAALLVLMPAALLATLAVTPRRVPPPSLTMRPLPPLGGTAMIPRQPAADGWDDEVDGPG
jgi:hypothetical protein